MRRTIFHSIICFFAPLVIALSIDCAGKIGCGNDCGGGGPHGAIRNPNVCTVEQLKKAAISLTLQVQSYVITDNLEALYSIVSRDTPILQNVAIGHPSNARCCQYQSPLWQFYSYYIADGAIFDYINPIPMGAVWSQTEGAVKIYSLENVYLPQYWSAEGRVYQIVYYWRPQYQCGVPVNITTCNLQLDYIDERFLQCDFGEPLCQP